MINVYSAINFNFGDGITLLLVHYANQDILLQPQVASIVEIHSVLVVVSLIQMEEI